MSTLDLPGKKPPFDEGSSNMDKNDSDIENIQPVENPSQFSKFH